MKVSISEKSKQAYEAATQKLGMTPQIPDLSILPADYALYLTAVLMLAVIIQAGKDGEVYDITNHSKRKFENWFYAEDGYEPGSAGGGFSLRASDAGHASSNVGARLSFNSSAEGRKIAEEYPDLWEIFILNVK